MKVKTYSQFAPKEGVPTELKPSPAIQEELLSVLDSRLARHSLTRDDVLFATVCGSLVYNTPAGSEILVPASKGSDIDMQVVLKEESAAKIGGRALDSCEWTPFVHHPAGEVRMDIQYCAPGALEAELTGAGDAFKLDNTIRLTRRAYALVGKEAFEEGSSRVFDKLMYFSLSMLPKATQGVTPSFAAYSLLNTTVYAEPQKAHSYNQEFKASGQRDRNVAALSKQVFESLERLADAGKIARIESPAGEPVYDIRNVSRIRPGPAHRARTIKGMFERVREITQEAPAETPAAEAEAEGLSAPKPGRDVRRAAREVVDKAVRFPYRAAVAADVRYILGGKPKGFESTLIAVEGIDGTGKSSVIRDVVSRNPGGYVAVHLTDFSDAHNPVAKVIGSATIGLERAGNRLAGKGGAYKVAGKILALLGYLTSAVPYAIELNRALAEEGKKVLSDRSPHTMYRAYFEEFIPAPLQPAARRALDACLYLFFDGNAPGCYVQLRLDPQVSAARAAARASANGAATQIHETPESLGKVQEAYSRVLEQVGNGRVVALDVTPFDGDPAGQCAAFRKALSEAN